MLVSPQAVHRTILVLDVEGFGAEERTTPHQVAARDGLYAVMKRACADAGIGWGDCYHEDRGDGLFLLAPVSVPKCVFVESFPLSLVKELRRYNTGCPPQARIRLRLAIHAGELTHDDHGVAGKALNFTFRLSDAPALKEALASSPGLLAVITSTWFFEEVVQHSPAGEPGSYRRAEVGVKETSTVGWICLPDHPYPSATPVSDAPRQLPAHTPYFVGRAKELATLDNAAIVAVNGRGGVGKTALAVQWARQAGSRFPDGQLYVDLRGFGGGPPVSPGEAIRGFLDALGVTRIPVGLSAQAALYRSVLAARRMLIVLDNAHDVAQVRPLLPGTPACTVVITSRDPLVDLVTWEGARPLTLGPLDLEDSRQLLVRRIGAARVASEPDSVLRLLERCAGLPLAVALIAARLELDQALSLRALADELAGETRDELRAVIAWAYQHLDPAAARMFRLLGLHPGAEASTTAAASLAGVPVDEARSTLTDLIQAELFTEVTPDRFASHDSLRDYAAAKTSTLDTEAMRQEAIRRLLDHYLYTFFAAGGYEIDDPPGPGVTPEGIRSARQATTWCTAEHRTLLRLIEDAHRLGFDAHAWKLAWALSSFVDRNGRSQDLVALQDCILSAVDRSGDDLARGRVHLMLGWMYDRMGAGVRARGHVQRALELLRPDTDELTEVDRDRIRRLT